MTIDLEHLAALHEAATQGEWEFSPEGVFTNEWMTCVVAWELGVDVSVPDAALIVAMRNALPELIERVREGESDAQEQSDAADHYAARVAHLEAGIKALADELAQIAESAQNDRKAAFTSTDQAYWEGRRDGAQDAASDLEALLNGTHKDTE